MTPGLEGSQLSSPPRGPKRRSGWLQEEASAAVGRRRRRRRGSGGSCQVLGEDLIDEGRASRKRRKELPYVRLGHS